MRKIKSFKLFENSSLFKAEECLSIVKEMLKELDFLDISHNAVIRRSDGVLFIRITIWKPIDQSNIRYGSVRLEDMPMSIKFEDISDVISTIKDYLESEGYIIDNDAYQFPMSTDGELLCNRGISDINSYHNLRTQCVIKFRNR
jgi:hypothetical protein